MGKGKFIVFEGGEGTGKSTQAALLADFLRQKGVFITLTREPGGTEGAELIRALVVSGGQNRWNPLSEVLLLNAARLDHWQKVILPSLEEGHWVICDRFTDSTIAYQGYGHGVSLSFIQTLHKGLFGGTPPDLTFVFDLDPVVGIQRSLQRRTSETRFENMTLDFHHRMRQGYLNLCKKSPNHHLIDASCPIAQIHETITRYVLMAEG